MPSLTLKFRHLQLLILILVQFGAFSPGRGPFILLLPIRQRLPVPPAAQGLFARAARGGHHQLLVESDVLRQLLQDEFLVGWKRRAVGWGRRDTPRGLGVPLTLAAATSARVPESCTTLTGPGPASASRSQSTRAPELRQMPRTVSPPRPAGHNQIN